MTIFALCSIDILVDNLRFFLFSRFGIRVNAVLPGMIDTEMMKTVPDNVKNLFLNKIPLRRFGKAEEVAELILFLASDKSSYVNGASIEITGGLG